MRFHAIRFALVTATTITVFFTILNQFIPTPPQKSKLYVSQTWLFGSLVLKTFIIFVFSLVGVMVLGWLYKKIKARGQF